MQKRGMWMIGLVILAVAAAAMPLRAQSKEAMTAPMFIYVSEWAVPRAQWGDMAKLGAEQRALEDKLLAEGTIVGYGEFENLIHLEGAPTHGSWFSANSQSNVLKALQAFMAQPDATAPVLAASKHWDHYLVSRMHNSRPGKYEDAYLSGSEWDVKPGQGQAFQNLLKIRVVPVLEKLLAEGALISYTIDTQNFVTTVPGRMEVVTIATDAAATDKVSKAFENAFSQDPEIGPAMGSLVKAGSHRDFLVRVTHLALK